MTEARRRAPAIQERSRQHLRAILLDKVRARALAHGWTWGHVSVAPAFQVDRPNGRYLAIDVNDLTIYVSPAGYTRVFRHGKELKSDAHRKADQANATAEGSAESGAGGDSPEVGTVQGPAPHRAGED